MNNSKIFDIAVVGSGMGGALIGALNKEKNIVVFEKESNVGGCASTFKRFGNYYNSGATTFVGYEEGHLLKKMFDKISIVPDIKEHEIAFRIIQGKSVVDRSLDFEQFLEQLNQSYPNKNNRRFWETIKQLDEKFWKLQHFYYGKENLKSYVKTMRFLVELLVTFKTTLFKSAQTFILETLGEISKEYESFINAQLLITVQSSYKELPLLSMALGLSYPFHKTYYVNHGMGSLIKQLLSGIDVRCNEEIISIKKEQSYYRLISKKGEYLAQKVILNTTVNQKSGTLFKNKAIHNYYNKFTLQDQSAFVVYMTLQSSEVFLQHYQIILDQTIPHTISNAFFVSISHKEDSLLSKKGYSLTISTHIESDYWKNLSRDEYEAFKEQTQAFIAKSFLEHFPTLQAENITQCFSATSVTFNRYIGRYNCGGNTVSFKNLLKLPICTTPFKGLYNVGDTLFTGQGWVGIALGVELLNKELNSI